MRRRLLLAGLILFTTIGVLTGLITILYSIQRVI